MIGKCGLVVVLLAASCAAQGLDYSALVDEAYLLAKAGALDQAAAKCETVIDAHPGAPAEPRAHLVLGYILIKRKAPAAQAEERFARLAGDFPASPEAAEALHCLGHFALRAGDAQLAVRRFEESAASSGATQEIARDSLVESGYALISAYWATTDRKFLAQAIERLGALGAPQSGDRFSILARLGVGEAYLIEGRASEAAAAYRSVVDLRLEDDYLRGLAQFELGCSLYWNREWEAAEAALEGFIDSQPGDTLQEKDHTWKALVPGYSGLVATDPSKAAGLAGVELVPAALYWRAMTLFELRRFREARGLVVEVRAAFPDCSVKRGVDRLASMLADVLGEGR